MSNLWYLCIFNQTQQVICKYLLMAIFFFLYVKLKSNGNRFFLDISFNNNKIVYCATRVSVYEYTRVCRHECSAVVGSTFQDNGTRTEQKRTYRCGTIISIWFKSICHLWLIPGRTMACKNGRTAGHVMI